MNSSRSLHRTLVDEALAGHDTNLADFVATRRTEGKSVEEIWMDLRQLTGIQVSSRTLYRWIDDLEAVA